MADQVTTSLAQARILVMQGMAGKAPRINETNYHWEVWDNGTEAWVDTGVSAVNGAPGRDGYTPTISVSQGTDGITVTISDGRPSGTTASYFIPNGQDYVLTDADKQEIADLLDDGVPALVTGWLDDNVTPVGSAVVVDSSLSIAGAAADAKVTGDEIGELKSDLANIITLQHSTFNGYFLLTADKVINAQNNVRIVYAEVPSDVHRISVSKTSGGVFQVGFTTVPPANGVHIIDEAGSYINATTGTSAVVNVPTTAVYIVAYVWNSVLDTTITAEDMIASVNISVIRGAKDIEARTDIIQLKDDVEDLQNDKANSDGTNTDYIEVSHDGYALEDITLTTGALDNHGVITPNTSFSITEPLYLTSNVEYTIQYKGYYDGTTEKNAPRMVCIYKADGTFSRAFAEITAITLYTDERYIIINGFTHETQLNVFKTVDGGVKNVLTAKALHIEYKNIDRVPAPLGDMSRRATFSFVFDDATDGDINVKALFDSYGLRCGFALPISALNETKVDRYLSYQNDGYEILSHSTDGTGMADPTVPVTTIEAKMKSSKETLEAYGFEINGFVTPSSAILATYIPALKRWYQFGYGQISDQSGYQVNTFSGKIDGIATDRDVSQLPRCSLEAPTSTVQFIKGIINTAINNNGYVCFYGHSYPSTTNNMTEENMIEILNYLTGLQSQGQIAILPPSQAIHSFYKVRHSDYLALANA